jgi:hypothetical protein
MNMVEKRAVELAFPHSIFVTINSSEYRILLPESPADILYECSEKRLAIKPWVHVGGSSPSEPPAGFPATCRSGAAR